MQSVPTCLRDLCASVFACQRGLRANVPTCWCGLCANVPKACQLLIYTCQRANERANVPYGVSIFQLGVPTCQKVCQIFKHSSYEMLREISILYTRYYRYAYMCYDVSYIKIVSDFISMVLGKLPQGKLSSNPKTNPNPNPNPNPNQRAIFLGNNCPDTYFYSSCHV